MKKIKSISVLFVALVMASNAYADKTTVYGSGGVKDSGGTRIYCPNAGNTACAVIQNVAATDLAPEMLVTVESESGTETLQITSVGEVNAEESSINGSEIQFQSQE